LTDDNRLCRGILKPSQPCTAPARLRAVIAMMRQPPTGAACSPHSLGVSSRNANCEQPNPATSFNTATPLPSNPTRRNVLSKEQRATSLACDDTLQLPQRRMQTTGN